MSKKRTVKVRFHLARGENFMKWQVKSEDGIQYIDPEVFSLVMTDCKLRNQKASAEKIFKGANKSVCAWVECFSLSVYPRLECEKIVTQDNLSYNPKIAPHWRDSVNTDVDNSVYSVVKTIGNKMYTV